MIFSSLFYDTKNIVTILKYLKIKVGEAKPSPLKTHPDYAYGYTETLREKSSKQKCICIGFVKN